MLWMSVADGFSADTTMSPSQMPFVFEDDSGFVELSVDVLLLPPSASSALAGCTAISTGCLAKVLSYGV